MNRMLALLIVLGTGCSDSGPNPRERAAPPTAPPEGDFNRPFTPTPEQLARCALTREALTALVRAHVDGTQFLPGQAPIHIFVPHGQTWTRVVAGQGDGGSTALAEFVPHLDRCVLRLLQVEGFERYFLNPQWYFSVEDGGLRLSGEGMY